MLAVIEGYRQSGMLPVNGVDVELVSQSFDSLDTDSKLAACQKFGTEDEVFAVLGGRIFTEGAECMATRFQTPVIDTDQPPAATIEAAAPYMFTLKPDETEIVTAFANWGIGRGSFDGKTIGLYWEGGHDAAADAFKQILTDNGLSIASEIQTGGSGSVGNEQDALAAQKFQADGVDLVVFFVGSSGIVNFLQAANGPELQAGLPRSRLGVAHERRRRRCLQPGPVGGRRGAVGHPARRGARSQPRRPRPASPTTRRSAARRSTATRPRSRVSSATS